MLGGEGRGIVRRTVAYDADAGVLTVGGLRAPAACGPGENEGLLRTYLDLVARQRRMPVDDRIQLRRDDVLVLAELLDLDDVDLEARLRRLLRLTAAEAADLHRRLLRRRMAIAAVGVGMLAAASAPTSVAASAPTAEAPAGEHDTDIGYSVRYERDPGFVPPEGVDIGDAMVIERDPTTP